MIASSPLIEHHLITLPVMEAFYTLQGEGFHQGRAAYFIRLGGCDVGCFWCDVKESWDASKHTQFTPEEIVAKALSGVNGQWSMVNRQSSLLSGQWSVVSPQPSTLNLEPLTGRQIIAVVTGGEPLMHNLDELTRQLNKAGFKTHIETSGSSPFTGKWDWICLSPKKFKAPLPQIIPWANELKIVVYNRSDFKWAEEFAVKVSPQCKLYLQPEWDKSAEVTPLIIEYIKSNPQWELSLQLHKYINVP